MQFVFREFGGINGPQSPAVSVALRGLERPLPRMEPSADDGGGLTPRLT